MTENSEESGGEPKGLESSVLEISAGGLTSTPGL